jgi:iron complex transport system ATP-binding protein
LAEPALALRDLVVRYRERRALDGVTFAVAPGEVVGLIGPNGSGKSTLLRAVSGVLPYESGSICLLGREVATAPRRELARHLAVVGQEGRSEFAWSALEVVLLGRHPHLSGLAFESARDLGMARQALARCGAAALADRPLVELSAGERQRVLFARALAQEPRVLLLDEALSSLDLRYQVERCDRVRELAAEGVAVVTVFHDLSLAAEYCDRVALLEEGRLAAFGPTAEVLTYARLTRVFATEIYVDVNDLTGGLVVTPLSSRARRALAARSGAPQID